MADEHDWKALREPFKDDEIAYKPQPISKDIKERGTCKEGESIPWTSRQGNQTRLPISRDGIHCGGFHAPSVHLTYVGHAALTERLDAVCGPENWNWEPFAVGADGLPAIKDGSLWIRLTIWGVTKIGVGDHEGQGGPVAHKVMIGDALRNAGMRFGIARYLWDKSEKARETAQQERGADDERQDLPASKPAQRARGGAAKAQQGEDPWAQHSLTDDGKDALVDLLATDDPERVRSLWREIRASGKPQTVTADILGDAEAAALGIAGPMDLLALATRVGEHLAANGISVAEHVAADAAPAPTPMGSGDAEAARDAADIERGADPYAELRKGARGRNGGQQG